MDTIHNPNDAPTSILTFEDRQVRMIDQKGEPWWIAADVCAVLGIAQPHRSLASLDDDEKGRHTVTTLGGPQEVAIVNEAGLYSLILRSRKEEAKRFKRWVTHEVLPALRKNGLYIVPGADASPEAAGALAIVAGFEEMRTTLAEIRDTMHEARRESQALPAPNILFPEMTNVDKIHIAARAFSTLTGTRINAVWPLVYAEIEFRYKIRLSVRAKKAGWKKSTLLYAVAAGHGELVYTVLWNLIRNAIPKTNLGLAS